MLPYLNFSLNDMQGEIWKDIPGFEGKYSISNMGRIKSQKYQYKCQNAIRTLKPRIRKQFDNNLGYLHMVLRKDGKPVCIKPHRLVALLFIENPLNLPQVNHIEANTYDNRWFKLEWIDNSGNVRHAIKLGLKKPNWGDLNGMAKLTKRQVKSILNSKETKTVLAAKYGISIITIKNIRSGKSWFHLTGRIHVSHKSIPKKKIIHYNKNGKEIGRYASIFEAARMNKISAGTVRNTANGKSKPLNGHIFKFE